MFVDRREISGPNGGPVEIERNDDLIDLSKLSEEELRSYAELCEKLSSEDET
jgi:hypothetical protein